MFKMRVDEELELVLVCQEVIADFQRLRLSNLGYLSQWLMWVPVCVSRNDFQSYVDESVRGYGRGESMNCAILYRGEVVGAAAFNQIHRQTGRVEIGYWLDEGHQGRGIITRCVQFLIDYAFEQLNMEKVEIRAAVDNRPSRNVAERLGMNLEGVQTRAECVGDRVLDHAIYGLLRSDYHK
ncbi:GNAT family N-acetyltransferase [Ferrimonas marina]|uniref:Ribosomal-protein-serine acetyltransferase n=1 Tax=Ferrimonas marina TaxID=299255 RepID=A0A1M5MJT3_9GAMM|nr:GNAT family protein [Ferrimonas marina]SHG77362.1 ribosomal-protein-serine acetyltransferase [Ferrimonas marina]